MRPISRRFSQDVSLLHGVLLGISSFASFGRGRMEFPEEPFMGGLPDKTEANCEGYDAKRYHLLDGILSKRGEFRKRNPPHLYINLSLFLK